MPEFGYPLPDRAYPPRPGAYGVVRDTRSLILLVEELDGTFYLPGGGIDSGETAEQAVVREFMEETGLEVSCGPKFASASQFAHCLDEPNGYRKICSFFIIDLVHEQPREPGELVTHWMDREYAHKAVHEEAHRWAIERLDVDT